MFLNLQLLDHLRMNRSNLKPPQIQMLEHLEKQMSSLQQVFINFLKCYSWSNSANIHICLCLIRLHPMKRQAAAGGQPRPGLPNGPSADPFNHHQHHAGPSNGSCSSSPSEAKMENRTDHTQGPGGGDASNGNVPYLQPNSLPHNRTAAGQPSTNSTWSPSPAEETWKSQQLNTNTQVTDEQTATHSLLDCVVNILLLLLLFSVSLKTSFFFFFTPGA